MREKMVTTSMSTSPAHIGPLTTIFSAPSSCASSTGCIAYAMSNSGFMLRPTTSNDCFPWDFKEDGYYSPGLCPDRFTTACPVTQDGIETAICCPTDLPFTCQPTFPYSNPGCYFVGSFNVLSSITSICSSEGGPQPSFGDSPKTFFAYGIRIQNAVKTTPVGIPLPPETPTTRFTDTTSSTQAKPEPPTSSSLYTSPTTTPTTTVNSQVSILANSAVGGIAIGVIGAMALGAIGTFLLMSRRRRRNSSPPPLPPKDFIPACRRSSLNATHELDGRDSPTEMPSWDERIPRGPNRPMAWELPA
ncbi:uncharacterized protein F4822DRAFT_328758 [Hypoxylon trugodes]|uniref:uncharacterized protein n=1 Tax=Hypoxylon trugodes TaxID=326681 RepID=UPI00219718A6|nr:uncharacterized protein F4822DRAFT_328758 [Hypoxylon trugodes]KAI1386882.1 hypothetical protein F4822DRAFT_328758 [Hypoxylon trugodes]